jgi:hypothetical protein
VPLITYLNDQGSFLLLQLLTRINQLHQGNSVILIWNCEEEHCLERPRSLCVGDRGGLPNPSAPPPSTRRLPPRAARAGCRQLARPARKAAAGPSPSSLAAQGGRPPGFPGEPCVDAGELVAAEEEAPRSGVAPAGSGGRARLRGGVWCWASVAAGALGGDGGGGLGRRGWWRRRPSRSFWCLSSAREEDDS